MTDSTSSFADRINTIPESFIREILKVSTRPDMISFAGGLPNPDFFPVAKMAEAAEKVFRNEGKTALQYAPTEGYLPLRDWIAQRQTKKGGVPVYAEDVLMLNGSQQGLDLCGKLLINRNTNILLEEPSYLGAIQAFSAYQPNFHSIKLLEGGPDVNEFTSMTRRVKPNFFYCIPNFQNPTGNCYHGNRRIELIEPQTNSDMWWIEDNPYGEIYFNETIYSDIHSILPRRTIHLGSFSKIISPGLRIGWAIGPKEAIKKMALIKQGTDLHTNNLSQRIVYQFLCDYSIDEHLESIRTFYKKQAVLMVDLIRSFFPEEVIFLQPQGGMFLWLTLPDNISAKTILDKAVENNVLFVPGEYFFLDPGKGKNTLRLNFSNPTEKEMKIGMKILGELISKMIAKPSLKAG
jgi:2-aminoadipate transaminase